MFKSERDKYMLGVNPFDMLDDTSGIFTHAHENKENEGKTAFDFFSLEQSNRLRKEMPDMTDTELAQRIIETWRTMPAPLKERYQNMAEEPDIRRCGGGYMPIQEYNRKYRKDLVPAESDDKTKKEERKDEPQEKPQRWIRKPRVLLRDCNIGPPLDYSFQDIKTMSEVPSHEPTAGYRKDPPPEEAVAESDGQSQDGDVKPQVRVVAKEEPSPKKKEWVSNGVRLSYNELTDCNGLVAAMEQIIEDPINNLTMLDLSHNQLSGISQEITKFVNLSVLYLHGNQITNINEVRKLAKLPNLQKLTLHGNALIIERPGVGKKVKRLEETPYYRPNIIYRLKETSLRSLDQVGITPRDRQNALVWNKEHRSVFTLI